MSPEQRITRRTVLRGLGTALAIPLLEAIPFAGNRALALDRAGAAGAPPVRMAFVFVPNGVHMPDWTPKTEGADFELPYLLEPLARVKHKLSVVSGLAHDKGRANGDGPGDHARSAAVFLTGAQPYKTPGANIRAGVSVDQVAAAYAGKETRFPSLELGCDKGGNTGNCDSGYSCAYSNNISWSSSNTPMAKESNPRRVFERLFAGDSRGEVAASRWKRVRERRSILDFVREDAARLRSDLGRADQQKLEEYLSGIREVEKRVERVGLAEQFADDAPRPEVPEVREGSLAYDEQIRLLADMMVLAFQSDTTRIATFMLANDGSNRNYRLIGVPDGHHDLSHHEGKWEKQEKIRRINRFHLTQLAYFLEKLETVKEGDGTLLDNSMIVYGSGIGDGNRHNHDDLPILLAGRGGGTIDSGRHIRVEAETPVCNLYLSLLDRMGARVDSLGDSTGRLRELET
ncbi:MAG TPA: DUF1552 domain-containing protein [Planctomycetota bacterium]|nr:DUF1552 domain-containing protein [Planctomycetota bacterium]